LGKVVLFLEQQHQLPPTNFLETLGQVQLPEEVHARIHDLVTRKLAGDELGMGAPDALLNIFIEEQLNKWSRPLFAVRSQVGLSQELENVLVHVLTEGEH
jgi:predicted nucleotidyltransferase